MGVTGLLNWASANWPVLILATIAMIALAAFLRPGEVRASAETRVGAARVPRETDRGDDA